MVCRAALAALAALAVTAAEAGGADRARGDVLVGLSAEFGDLTSTSDDAIRLGMQLAIDAVNRAGGVLGGRKLALVERDNRGVPARMVADVRELASMKDLVALFCGKFSPPVIEAMPVARELRLPILDPWAAGDPLVDDDPPPGWVFRLSLRDSWAMEAALAHLAARGIRAVGLLAPGTSWGRSSERALRRILQGRGELRLVGGEWYHFGATTLRPQYDALLRAGARGLVLVANEGEGAVLVRELAELPRAQRIPIASHWGIAGGDFAGLAGPALREVDLAVVQTYDLAGDPRPLAQRVRREVEHRTGRPARLIPSTVGLAHAYDLVLVLARAVDLAGTTDRSAVRGALEQVRDVPGLLRTHARPFAPGRHEALSPRDVFMSRYAADGGLEPVSR